VAQLDVVREDILNAVGILKAQCNGVLAIMGSGQLISSLMTADLIDEYLLMIHPLALGTRRRLFPEVVEVKLRHSDSVATPSGVVVATYEPATDNA
jgi:dihydrofolate reductase